MIRRLSKMFYNTCKKIIYIINFYNNRAYVATVRWGLPWLPVRERDGFKLAAITYKTQQTRKPTYIAELLVDRVHTRELCSSADRTQLVTPRTRNKQASRAFSSAAHSTWNALPSDIRECDTLRRG